MGDGIKAMHDDYDTYQYYCEKYNQKQLPIFSRLSSKSFYDHYRQLDDYDDYFKKCESYNIKPIKFNIDNLNKIKEHFEELKLMDKLRGD